MREVVLCNLSCISNDYTHVVDFATKDKRDVYYASKRIVSYKGRYKNDGARETITFPIDIEKISRANYLYLDYNNKRHFYFITNRKQLTETLTELEVELDVWTTYMFDYTVLESYVERCHQDRWTKDGLPVINTVDEGLPLQDYIQDGVEDLYTYNNGVIITSTQPLGTLQKFVVDNDNNNGNGGNEWDNSFGTTPDFEINIPSFNEDGTLVPGGGSMSTGNDTFYSSIEGIEPYHRAKLDNIPSVIKLDWVRVTDGFDNYYRYDDENLPTCKKGGLRAEFSLSNLSNIYTLSVTDLQGKRTLWHSDNYTSDSPVDELLPHIQYIALGKQNNDIYLFIYGTNKVSKCFKVGRIEVSEYGK